MGSSRERPLTLAGNIRAGTGVERTSEEAGFLGLGTSSLSGREERREGSGVVAVETRSAVGHVTWVVGAEARVSVERVALVLLLR